ncbi:MAG: hypothetical protein K9K78_05640 [Spirochaetales bacterium]|nr:hypothetical protein [Spirochaetales bacterium]
MKTYVLRTTVLLLLVLALAAPLAAGDFGIKIGDIETQGDVLFGFFPTLLEVGGKYTGFSIIEGYETSLEFMTGGGFMGRNVWRDKDGEPLASVDWDSDSDQDEVGFNVWSARWEVLLKQGFGWFELEKRNPAFFYAGIEGRWEQFEEDGDETFFLDSTKAGIYPNSKDDGLVSNNVVTGLLIDFVSHNGPVHKGIKAELSYRYAPPFMANNILGSSDYSLLTAEFTGALPLFMKYQDNGYNLFSIYAIDRVRGDLFYGDDIPMFAQEPASLGSKMRGLERLSYATRASVVNNFDIRFIGPEFLMKDIYPRLHLFFDAGYFSGQYSGGVTSSTLPEEGFITTTGFTAALSVFDFANIGYRGSWMLSGENIRNEDYVSDIILMLQFNL